MAPQSKQKKINVFNDRRNFLYDKSASFRCDGRLFHSPGPAAENALSPKELNVHATTHVRLAVERSRRSRASATRRQSSARYDGATPDNDSGERTWPPWSGRAGALVASVHVVDGAPAIYGRSVEYRSPDGQRFLLFYYVILYQQKQIKFLSFSPIVFLVPTGLPSRILNL